MWLVRKVLSNTNFEMREEGAPCKLDHPTPYTPHPTPYTPHPTPSTQHPTPYTLHPTPYTLHPTPYLLHPTPCTLHPTPSTLNPTPFTLHPAPVTLHPAQLPRSECPPGPAPHALHQPILLLLHQSHTFVFEFQSMFWLALAVLLHRWACGLLKCLYKMCFNFGNEVYNTA